MTAKHTPGPWRCIIGDDHGIEIYQDDGRGNGDHIGAYADHPDAAANAAVIGASPDLLAACEESRAAFARIARSIMEDDPLSVTVILTFVSEVLTPAIAKAEGRS